MSTDVTTALETGLYSALNVSAITNLLGGAKLYAGLAPAGTALPYVIFVHSGGGDRNTTPTRDRMGEYLVKAVAATKSAAGSIAAQIDAALHNKVLTVTGYTNYWTARADDVSYPEVLETGAVIWHVGGYYRVLLTKS